MGVMVVMVLIMMREEVRSLRKLRMRLINKVSHGNQAKCFARLCVELRALLNG